MMRYLSRTDIENLGLTPNEIVDAVSRSFAGLAEGRVVRAPTLGIPVSSTARFVAKGGVVGSVAAMKWFGYFPHNVDMPAFHPVICVNDRDTGLPLSIMDGTWISEIRTASISAVAARILARDDAATLGFVACGAQARAHLALFRDLFPIANVLAYSRSAETARAFCDTASESGLKSDYVTEASNVLAAADIIISSVPLSAVMQSPLRAEAVPDGSFISMVDRGFSWAAETIPDLEMVITDDMELSGPGGQETLNLDPSAINGDLAELVAHPPADRPLRSALIFSGPGFVDASVAELVLTKAVAASAGTMLDF